MKESFLKFQRVVYIGIGIVGLCAFLSGCGPPEHGKSPAILVTVGDRVATVQDFGNALERAKSAYSTASIKNPDSFVEICQWVLNQMIEEMVLLAAADEAGVAVSDRELRDTMESIKKDYPDDVFDQLLLENAISEAEWEQRLKVRLLLEKTIRTLLPQPDEINENDIQNYFRELSKKGDRQPDAGPDDDEDYRKIIDAVREQKRVDALEELIRKFREKTPPIVNEEQWRRILSKRATASS